MEVGKEISYVEEFVGGVENVPKLIQGFLYTLWNKLSTVYFKRVCEFLTNQILNLYNWMGSKEAIDISQPLTRWAKGAWLGFYVGDNLAW